MSVKNLSAGAGIIPVIKFCLRTLPFKEYPLKHRSLCFNVFANLGQAVLLFLASRACGGGIAPVRKSAFDGRQRENEILSLYLFGGEGRGWLCRALIFAKSLHRTLSTAAAVSRICLSLWPRCSKLHFSRTLLNAERTV